MISRCRHLVKDFYGGTICHTSHTPRNPGFIRQDFIHSTSTSHIPFPFILPQPRRHTATQEERVSALKQGNQHHSRSLQQPSHGRSIFFVDRFDTASVDCTNHPIRNSSIHQGLSSTSNDEPLIYQPTSFYPGRKTCVYEAESRVSTNYHFFFRRTKTRRCCCFVSVML